MAGRLAEDFSEAKQSGGKSKKVLLVRWYGQWYGPYGQRETAYLFIDSVFEGNA